MWQIIKEVKQIEVVAAIIHDEEGRIFTTQRGYGEMKDGWEFPGGKMEPGESPEEALKREIWEELETKIVVEKLVQTVLGGVGNKDRRGKAGTDCRVGLPCFSSDDALLLVPY